MCEKCLPVVREVNGELPDVLGRVNIEIPQGTVTKVNTVAPDATGNVTIVLPKSSGTANKIQLSDGNGNFTTNIDLLYSQSSTDSALSIGTGSNPSQNGKLGLGGDDGTATITTGSSGLIINTLGNGRSVLISPSLSTFNGRVAGLPGTAANDFVTKSQLPYAAHISIVADGIATDFTFTLPTPATNGFCGFASVVNQADLIWTNPADGSQSINTPIVTQDTANASVYHVVFAYPPAANAALPIQVVIHYL